MRYVAFLCHRFCIFCRGDFDPGKMRDKGNGLTVATAVRTAVVLIFSWLMVFVSDSFGQITSISGYTFLFLILSGAATGASWLCYFKALQTGDVNKVVPIDKSSTVLTIILALIFLHEGISLPKAAAVIVIAAGVMLMIERKDVEETKKTGKGGGGHF